LQRERAEANTYRAFSGRTPTSNIRRKVVSIYNLLVLVQVLRFTAVVTIRMQSKRKSDAGEEDISALRFETWREARTRPDPTNPDGPPVPCSEHIRQALV